MEEVRSGFIGIWFLGAAGSDSIFSSLAPPTIVRKYKSQQKAVKDDRKFAPGWPGHLNSRRDEEERRKLSRPLLPTKKVMKDIQPRPQPGLKSANGGRYFFAVSGRGLSALR